MLQQISAALNVSERAVGAGLTATAYSAFVEGRGMTNSLIEGAVMTASDAVGQTLGPMVPFGQSSSWDIGGMVATGAVYAFVPPMIGYGGPFNSYLGNFFYGVAADAVGQGVATTGSSIIEGSGSTHHTRHAHAAGV